MKLARRTAALILACVPVCAQYSLPPAPDVLLVGEIRTRLSRDEVMSRLDGFYQEQVGRKISAALPKLAQDLHYEVWHDMWVYFSSDAGWLNLTLKRPTDAATILVAKGWMLQIAGRVNGELPMRFQELPPLRSASGDFYGSRRDAAAVMKAQVDLELIPTWQSSGLLVSSASLTRITLAKAGMHGVHRLTVTAESAAGAKQIAAKLTGMARPCLCSVYSEAADLDEEFRREAREKAEDVNATTAQKVYLSHVDPKFVEDKLRAEPVNQKRLAAAAGWYVVRYRVDKPYAKLHIRWSELTGYTRDDGKFDGERALGASTAVNVRPAAQVSAQLTGRTKMEALKPGAYRIAIEGENAAGEKVAIDRRDYWFDGHTFEEL